MNENYLNHSFKVMQELTKWTDGKCEICGIYVFYSKTYKVHYLSPSENGVGQLNITCKEQQIKKLLE